MASRTTRLILVTVMLFAVALPVAAIDRLVMFSIADAVKRIDLDEQLKEKSISIY